MAVPPDAAAAVHSPMPDLQSLQGAYVGNISRLEEHAERMSEAGSDLDDEIRKLHAELKAGSRRSSLRSLGGDEPARVPTGRSRAVSTSSHANSVVDTNGPARWGGYSPGGYVTSPVGSLRSGSWSNPPSLQRHRSGSKASRLGQVVHPAVREDNQPNEEFDDRNSTAPPQRHVSSFTRAYEAIASEIRDEMRYALPDRPPTAASTDTSHQARTLWHDFDGTHAPDTVPEEDEGAPAALPPGAPPPADGMVFYPAPVPRMLNLPKRLSQLPAADVAARRRTQVLDQMQAEHRKSAPWLGGPEPPKNTKARQSVAGLPAALRASVFFDQPAPPQEFDVKGESAADTLDSILEASARAPVSAFTDHPYAPQNRKSKLSLAEPVYVEPPPARRRGSFNILDTNTNSSGARLNKLKKRNSSADLNILVARAAESRMSLGADLDEDEHARDNDHGPNDHGPNDHAPNDPTSPRTSSDGHADADAEEQALDDADEQQFFGAPTTLLAELQLRKAKQKERNMNYVTMVEEGRITSHRTLLDLNDDAEREHQKRLKKKVQLAWEAQDDDESDDDVPLGVLYKQPQRNNDWNRPLGLIAQRELEENEPLSRRRERITGIPNHKRTTTLGPYDSQTSLGIPRVITPQPESDEEHPGETLGERRRRIADKKMLEDALGDDVRKSTVSGDFAAEMLAKLGGDSPKATTDPPAPEDGEEETLGQRRARLKAESEARGDVLAPADRPALRARMSLADVLGANPYDDQHQARKVSNEQLLSHLPAGSLLHQNAVLEEKRKAQRLTQNMRASSYGMPANPLVPGGRSVASNDDDQPLALKIQAYKDKMAGLGPQDRPQSTMFPAGMTSQPNMSQQSLPQPNMMGMPFPMQPMPQMMPMAMPMMTPAVHPGMGNRQSSMPMQMSLMQQGPQMNVPGGMPMMQGMGMNMNMNMPMQGMNMQGMNMQGMNMNMQGMNMQSMNMQGMNMPMGMLQPMNTQQRNNIEGWMKGIR